MTWGVEEGALVERMRVDGTAAEVSFTVAGELRWCGIAGGGGKERCLAVEEEVLGFEMDGASIRLKAFVGSLKGVSCGGSFGKRVRRDFVLEMPSEKAALAWSRRLTDCIESLGRPKRLLIMLNPYGGKKCARKIFHNEVRPLLVAANVIYTLQETEYQLHAQEIAIKLDLLEYDGVVCVSGDGVLVECKQVVSGLLQREDWENAIKMPLGIIPAGTGNGMVKSLMDAVGETCSIMNATVAIIRGHKRSLDVATILQGERRFFSVLMLSWGFVADVDIESEKYRWMGSARIDFYSLLRIMNLRRYHGCVHFVPAPGYEVYGESMKKNGSTKVESEMLRQADVVDCEVQQCGYQGPNICLEDMDWRSITGPFILVWINNVPWSGEDILAAPAAKFSDGYLDVIIIKECSKQAFLSLCLRMCDGGYIKSPYVMYLKVKALRLEPGQRVGNPAKGGIIDSDGEVIARGEGTYECHQQGDLMAYGPPIQMTVGQGLATIFSPR